MLKQPRKIASVNVIELIKDNEFEQHMSPKLWSVYYELERQQKNLAHANKSKQSS